MDEDCKKIRVTILEMIYRAKQGHIPSAFSVVEILYTLYANMSKEDSFFLSKGHASAGFYAVLAHFGFLKEEDLFTFCKYDSKLGGHPHRTVPHILNSSGSLGHGFPTAAGYALAKKIKKEPGRVFCLVGDGETNEGSIWETFAYAKKLELNNLVCVIDNNNSQTRAVPAINLEEKIKAFGWETHSVNGHSGKELMSVLFSADVVGQGYPVCVVANTVKGKGVKAIEQEIFSWHYRAPTDEELALFKKEIMQA